VLKMVRKYLEKCEKKPWKPDPFWLTLMTVGEIAMAQEGRSEYIDVDPRVIRELAKKHGFDYRRVLARFREKGVIVANHGYHFNTTKQGKKVTAVRFVRKKVFHPPSGF